MSDFGEHPGRRKAEGGVLMCGACLRIGRCRLGITAEEMVGPDENRVRLSCPADHEGGPGVAHGGWIASVFDEAMGHLCNANGMMSVTATLSVDYLRPVPIERPLLIKAHRLRGEKGVWHTSAELILETSDALLARATGKFVERDRTHFARFRQWITGEDTASRT